MGYGSCFVCRMWVESHKYRKFVKYRYKSMLYTATTALTREAVLDIAGGSHDLLY